MSDLVKYIKSGSRIPGIKNSLESVVIGLPGTPTELIIYQGKIYVYDSAGQTVIDGGYIGAGAFEAASVTTSKLVLTNKKFINNIDFTATDNNTCSWDAGSIIFADGTQISTNSGNTGNMAATTYVFYNGSSTNLQTTTTMSSAIGGSNMPLAIANPVGTDDGKCIVTPFLAVGTTIDGDKITTGKIQSSDAKTYFDLANDVLIVNDGTYNRILIGYQSGGF